MFLRGHVGSVLLAGLLAIPLTSKHGDFELFSQDAIRTTTPSDSSAWDALRSGIEDKDAQHRETAIAAIGTIRDDSEAVELVVRGLQDEDSGVRQTAAATLGAMGAHAAIPNLQAALDDNPEVSFAAAKSLWDLGDTSSRGIIQAVMLGKLKDKPRKLVSAEQTPDRTDAVAILAKDPDPSSLGLLERALGDKDWAVRVAVAKALGERGNERTLAKLSPLLTDERHAVRYMVAASMVKLEHRSVTTALR
jgi:HEAT repeat protein